MSLISAAIRLLTNTRSLDVSVVDANGDQITSFSTVATPPANAALTSVATSTTSAVLAAANANRRQLFVVNDAGKPLRVAFAATASAAAHTILIGSNQSKEFSLNGYTGVVSGQLEGGSGTALVTEVTV